MFSKSAVNFIESLKNTVDNFWQYFLIANIPNKDGQPINSFYKSVRLIDRATLHSILVGCKHDIASPYNIVDYFFPVVPRIIGMPYTVCYSAISFTIAAPFLLLVKFAKPKYWKKYGHNTLKILEMLEIMLNKLCEPLCMVINLAIYLLMIAAKIVVWLAALLITPLVWIADKIFSKFAAKNEVVSDTQSVDKAQNGRATETHRVAETPIASAEEQVKISTVVDSKEIDGLQNGIETEITLEKEKSTEVSSKIFSPKLKVQEPYTAQDSSILSCVA